MKLVIILLFSGCLTSSYCSAQKLEEDADTAEGIKSRPSKTVLLTVTFIPDDTCSLVINRKDYGEVPRNTPKTIRLYPGNYSLVFESLETGEAIKNRSFRLTRDSLRNGKYTYPVTFKQN